MGSAMASQRMGISFTRAISSACCSDRSESGDPAARKGHIAQWPATHQLSTTEVGYKTFVPFEQEILVEDNTGIAGET